MSGGATITTINACLIPHKDCKGGYYNRLTGLRIRCLCSCHTRGARLTLSSTMLEDDTLQEWKNETMEAKVQGKTKEVKRS